uniref:Uncharacterized protein n=1 Tax=Candidatus Nitrotoga fabula TaxID=2182327 RepID=A0A2X0QVK2_9PROT|nr:protein of unknown function [Candidatus Nitrotoga fabula]
MTIEQKPTEPALNIQSNSTTTHTQPATEEKDWLAGVKPQPSCNMDPNDPNSTCESCT